MSSELEDPAVLEKLRKNIAHLIGTLYDLDVIPKGTRHLDVEITDADKHQFRVSWDVSADAMEPNSATTEVVIGEYTIRLSGKEFGAKESKLIATLIAETVDSSLQMLEHGAREALW